MNYKEEYNEWAGQYWQETGNSPSLNESINFYNSWYDRLCDNADRLRKEEKGE